MLLVSGEFERFINFIVYWEKNIKPKRNSTQFKQITRPDFQNEFIIALNIPRFSDVPHAFLLIIFTILYYENYSAIHNTTKRHCSTEILLEYTSRNKEKLMFSDIARPLFLESYTRATALRVLLYIKKNTHKYEKMSDTFIRSYYVPFIW